VKTPARPWPLVLALAGHALLASAAEPPAELFRSVVTAENLDLANTAEFPVNRELAAADPKGRETFFLSLLGVRGDRGESRGGWSTGETEEKTRHLRVAFKEPLPVGSILMAWPAYGHMQRHLAGVGAVSYLKSDAPFPGDVNDDAQWVDVPRPEGQAGLLVWTFPQGVVTRTLRFSFTDQPPPGKPSGSRLPGAVILAARLHNLTPEADAYASTEQSGERHRVGNLVNELAGSRPDPIGYSYATGQWTAAPEHDVSRERPQWVVFAWPEAKTFSGAGLLNAFAKEIEIDALAGDAAGHPAVAPESAWKKVGAVTWPVWWRPSYTAVQVPFVAPVTTRALRVRVVKTLSDESPDIAGHFERNPKDRNRHVSLGGLMAFTDLGAAPVPARPVRVEEPSPLRVDYAMPYDGTVTLAIDDADGRRVRNLIADVSRSLGKQSEPWDGRDENGSLVPPGTYTVKGIAHEPLHLTYRGTVNASGSPPWSTAWHGQIGPGGWLSDHEPPNDVMAFGERLFVSALIAESGHGILACDLDGTKLWGEHRFGGPNGLAYAGFLAHDAGKVYTAGMGWGPYLGITEIDPTNYSSRGGFIRLDYGTGDAATDGLSGLAARGGKLYLTFTHPPLSWFARSAINTTKVDEKQTTAGELALARVLSLLRSPPPGVGDPVVREPWKAQESSEPVQHLRLAFTKPQAIGTLILSDAVDVSALAADAPYPGDLADDDQWVPFTAAAGPLRVLTAPAGQAQTRALRFTFRNAGGTPWRGAVRGAHLLPRRFESITAGATFTASSGTVGADGAWETVRETPITPEAPAALVVAWPEERTWRGLALLGAFAKRIAVDAYTGPAGAAPAAAPESAWSQVGELTPAVRWRPLYSDDYFDAGRDVTSRAIRLRVVEPWVRESPDIASTTGGKPTRAGLGGLVVLRHAGDDPPCDAIPAQRISIADIATAKWERHVAVAEPSWPTFDPQGRLTLVSAKRVVRLNLDDGKTEPVLPEGAVEDPRGIAFDAQGNMYVADGGPEVVKAFAPDGKLVRVIGEPGGREVGPYNPERIENPRGIAIDARGNLWVAECDFQPKRTSVWSPEGTLLEEFIGPSNYGGGGQVDPRDPSRIYYGGMEFSLDYGSGRWALKRILSRSVLPPPGTRFDGRGQAAFTRVAPGNDTREGQPDRPIYLNGRQYMVSDPSGLRNPLLLVGEFRGDRVVPLAAAGNAEYWWPLVNEPALRRLVGDRHLKGLGFCWSDRDGDGMPQPGEVRLFDVRLDPTYWPTLVNPRLEVQMGGRVLAPTGFTEAGAPLYDPAAATPVKLPVESVYATAVDSQGRMLINGNPLTGLDTDGRILWTYPNRHLGVHGSHTAPDPRPGELTGTLGFIGQEEIPGIGEVFMLSSNIGQWYLFTADGLLAATVWHDHRTPDIRFWEFPKAELGMSLDKVSLGGEHFGGSFQRADDGTVYLVAGKHYSGHVSVVELTGLETMRRLEATVSVGGDDLAAVEAWRMRREMQAARVAPPKLVTLAAPPAPVRPDGNLGEWDAGAFRPIGTRGAFAATADDKNLYVAWRVDGGQPLRNAGDEPNLLFRSGDSVDLQIGVDPDADPGRAGPVPGDQRLLVSLFAGKPIGVLYRHRAPGTSQKDRIGFSSPWRTEYVDRIDRLDPANIGIAGAAKGYAVEAVVPLGFLGFEPQPGKKYRIDFGILSADSSGSATVARTYWANRATGLVNDAPGEIMLAPGLWGEAAFAR
jgi:hypothetical protein